ncbi:hypothetical protein K438DRAFT_1778987 [Mycena galopus ATCC 62051]|nr:hypothetical protein K438DRAFT_1778987 [Mycena galopus ATCC 62051]
MPRLPSKKFCTDFVKAVRGKIEDLDPSHLGHGFALIIVFKQHSQVTTLESYIRSLVMTLAACHIGSLSIMRNPMSFEEDRKKIGAHAWNHLQRAGVNRDFEHLMQEVDILLSISRQFYGLHRRLPTLVENWCGVHMFFTGAAMRQLPYTMLKAEDRQGNGLEIVRHLSKHVSGALLDFAVELNESN